MTEREREEIISRVLERLESRKTPEDCLLAELSVEGMMEVSLGLALCPEARQVMEALSAGKPVKLGGLACHRYSAPPKALRRLWAEAEDRLRRMGIRIGGEGACREKRLLVTRQMAEEMAARGEPPPRDAILTPLAADVWKAR